MSGVKVKGGSTSPSLHGLDLADTIDILPTFLAALRRLARFTFFDDEIAASWLPSPYCEVVSLSLPVNRNIPNAGSEIV